MRYLILFSACATFASPVIAQDAETVGVPGNCAELAAKLDIVKAGDGAKIEDSADGCHATDIRISLDHMVSYKVDELTIQAPGLFDALAEDRLPPEAEISLTGIRIGPNVDDPLYQYILEMQAHPFDAHLHYRWDSDAGTLELADASIGDAEWGYLSGAARFSGLTQYDWELARTGAAVNARVHELTLTMDNPELFTGFVLTPLVSMLPPNEDPRPHIASYQKAAIAMINGLPETMIDADGKTVMESFINSFPRPKGEYVFSARSEDGVNLLQDDPSAYLGLLDPQSGLTLAASHTGEGN